MAEHKHGDLRRLFDLAIAAPAHERGALLERECGGDAGLKNRIEAMVAAAENERFLSAPTAHGGPASSRADETLDTPAGSASSATAMAGSHREGPGTGIGPYKILRLIGEGGFGSVFMAQQEQPVQRRVALKIIKLGMDTAQVVARFEQERQALAILDHPNIAKVFDAGATETGRPYFVMELCTGEPIDAYCDKNNLSIHERLELFAQVCAAVQHAHTKGIIHRDIKPSNVLVASQDGRAHAKVIDFGIAKATSARLTERTLFTEHRQIIGTPEYMSPEQAEGSLDIDTRTDVYALGVMLYELLTGSTPFSSRELRSAAYAEIQRIIREVEPPKPSTRLSQQSDTLANVAAKRRTEPRKLGTLVRGELDWIVMKALEKDRQRRYETANGLMMDIRRYLEGQAVEAAPPSAAYRFRKFVRRNRVMVAAGGAVAAALVLGVVGTSVGMVRANHAADAERIAKLEADHKRQEAETNLAFAKSANQILGSVFSNLDPQQNYRTIAEFRGALRENLDSAVKRLDASPIGDPADVAEMQNTLGRSLQRLGDPQRAIPLFVRSLATFKSARGEDHASTVDAANNLAVAYLDSGKPELALPLLEQAQQRRETKDGLDKIETITGMRNLGGAYFKLGNTQRAEELAKRAQEIALAKLGPDSPETLQCSSSLATLYASTDRAGLAVPLFEETLKRQTAKLGRDHPDTLHTLQSLANAYGAVGRGDRALPMLEDAAVRAKAGLGEDHALTLNIMSQLGVIYWGMGRFDDAIALFERVLVHQERLLGRGNPATLGTIANLGVNYKAAGRIKEAIPLLEEATAGADKDPELNGYAPELLEAYAAVGEHAKAAKFLEAALADARKDLPGDSPDLASLLAQLGLARLSLRQWDQAEALLRESLAIREKAQPDAWTTFNTKSMLGGALLGKKKLDEAEPMLLDGYKGMKEREAAIPPQGTGRIIEALERLVEMYEAKGDQTEAAAWRGKLEAAKSERRKAGTEPGK